MYDLFNLNKYAESHLRDKHKWQIGGWEKKRAGYFLKYKPIFQSFLGNVYICINTTNYFNCSVNISINFIDQLNFFSILNIEKKKRMEIPLNDSQDVKNFEGTLEKLLFGTDPAPYNNPAMISITCAWIQL